MLRNFARYFAKSVCFFMMWIDKVVKGSALLLQFWIVLTSESDIALRSLQAFMSDTYRKQGQGCIHIPALCNHLIQRVCRHGVADIMDSRTESLATIWNTTPLIHFSKPLAHTSGGNFLTIEFYEEEVFWFCYIFDLKFVAIMQIFNQDVF